LGDRQGIVIIAADTIEEANSPEARNLALQTAASHGISRPGISGNASAYPVDEDGETSQEMVLGRKPAVGFRIDYPVTGML